MLTTTAQIARGAAVAARAGKRAATVSVGRVAVKAKSWLRGHLENVSTATAPVDKGTNSKIGAGGAGALAGRFAGFHRTLNLFVPVRRSAQ